MMALPPEELQTAQPEEGGKKGWKEAAGSLDLPPVHGGSPLDSMTPILAPSIPDELFSLSPLNGMQALDTDDGKGGSPMHPAVGGNRFDAQRGGHGAYDSWAVQPGGSVTAQAPTPNNVHQTHAERHTDTRGRASL